MSGHIYCRELPRYLLAQAILIRGAEIQALRIAELVSNLASIQWTPVSQKKRPVGKPLFVTLAFIVAF